MSRYLACSLAAVTVVAFAPARADACKLKFVDMFTRYDAAAIVADVEVDAIASDGTVTFTRRASVKGDDAIALTGRTGRMCPPHYTEGQVGLAFADASGAVSWIESNPKPLRLALGKWTAAATAADKEAVLTALAGGKNATLKLHAKERLALDKAGQKAASWDAPAAKWKKPGSKKAVTARLYALWPAMQAAAGTGAGLDQFADAFASKQCGTSPMKTTAKEAATSVRDSMGTTTDPSVVGSLAGLDALGDAKLWLATCGVGFDSLFAYIKQSDGALVMVWLPPEG